MCFNYCNLSNRGQTSYFTWWKNYSQNNLNWFWKSNSNKWVTPCVKKLLAKVKCTKMWEYDFLGIIPWERNHKNTYKFNIFGILQSNFQYVTARAEYQKFDTKGEISLGFTDFKSTLWNKQDTIIVSRACVCVGLYVRSLRHY